MPIKFAVKIKGLYNICSPMTLTFIQGHTGLSHLTNFNLLQFNSNISDNIQAVAFKLGMTVNLCMAYIYICTQAHFDDLELDASVTVSPLFLCPWLLADCENICKLVLLLIFNLFDLFVSLLNV